MQCKLWNCLPKVLNTVFGTVNHRFDHVLRPELIQTDLINLLMQLVHPFLANSSHPEPHYAS